MLIPKKVKHRKWQKGRSSGLECRGTEISFGSFGLKSLEGGRVSSKQLEAGRRMILHYLKKGGKLWVRIFPDKPITKKGIEVPMGGGKGMVDHYVFPVRPGRVIFEIEVIKEDQAKEALRKAGDKLAVKTKFIRR